jgi:DNA modification methylase
MLLVGSMSSHSSPARNPAGFSIDRLPPQLQTKFRDLYKPASVEESWLAENRIHAGDARTLLKRVSPNSVALSFWSPPYFVGKSYEEYLDFAEWKMLMAKVIALHFQVLKPGGFLVINIADILVFKDESMPRIQADVVTGKRSKITTEDVLAAMAAHPKFKRYQLAEALGCSEQTIDRRLNGNNIRGGKQDAQTRVQIVGGMIEEWARHAGLYLYDRRVWVKDPAWENSRWHSQSYRSVDEFEYLYMLWKPGILRFDRNRISADEWREWGSRGVWHIRSVRANNDHEAKFPVELALRVIRLLSEPGELVLDCFMGSGTTAEAAIAAGRKFIGIERLQTYVDLATKRINEMLLAAAS